MSKRPAFEPVPCTGRDDAWGALVIIDSSGDLDANANANAHSEAKKHENEETHAQKPLAAAMTEKQTHESSESRPPFVPVCACPAGFPLQCVRS